MSLFDGKPIKRVDFNPRPAPEQAMPHQFDCLDMIGCSQCGATCEEIDDGLAPKSCPGKAQPQISKAEQEWIWRATRATAEGTNIAAEEQ